MGTAVAAGILYLIRVIRFIRGSKKAEEQGFVGWPGAVDGVTWGQLFTGAQVADGGVVLREIDGDVDWCAGDVVGRCGGIDRGLREGFLITPRIVRSGLR